MSETITIDFSRSPQELYYEYKITVEKDKEGKIYLIDGNNVVREYSIVFENIDKSEKLEIKGFITVDPEWPEHHKRVVIESVKSGMIAQMNRKYE